MQATMSRNIVTSKITSEPMLPRRRQTWFDKGHTTTNPDEMKSLVIMYLIDPGGLHRTPGIQDRVIQQRGTLKTSLSPSACT